MKNNVQEFLTLLKTLSYIGEFKIIETVPYFTTVNLNGRFARNFQMDMERERGRIDFMAKYGDPLNGLNLRKHIVLWYPTYFTVVRISFAL